MNDRVPPGGTLPNQFDASQGATPRPGATPECAGVSSARDTGDYLDPGPLAVALDLDASFGTPKADAAIANLATVEVRPPATPRRFDESAVEAVCAGLPLDPDEDPALDLGRALRSHA